VEDTVINRTKIKIKIKVKAKRKVVIRAILGPFFCIKNRDKISLLKVKKIFLSSK